MSERFDGIDGKSASLLSDKREEVGSSPTDGIICIFCNSSFLYVAYISNQPTLMKSTVTYT